MSDTSYTLLTDSPRGRAALPPRIRRQLPSHHQLEPQVRQGTTHVWNTMLLCHWADRPVDDGPPTRPTPKPHRTHIRTIAQLGVAANADTPEDARVALQYGAVGIGLCRTEHMCVRLVSCACARVGRAGLYAYIDRHTLTRQFIIFVNTCTPPHDDADTNRFFQPGAFWLWWWCAQWCMNRPTDLPHSHYHKLTHRPHRPHA